jgi:tetratricopeptide (TPR) repeat protein
MLSHHGIPAFPLLPRRTTPRTTLLSTSRSARDQERREEAQRRQERVKDVVIGQTSAVPGAQDYALNTQQTEQEWLRSMTPDEKMIYQYTEQGMEHLKLLRVTEAVDAFQQVYTLKPDAYVWQAGLALYYVHDYKSAADRLAQCARTYETKLGQPATEERIWWYACQLRFRFQHPSNKSNDDDSTTTTTTSSSSSSSSSTTDWTPLPYNAETTDPLLASETRKVVRIAHKLFRASFENIDPLAVVVARAQLWSIAAPPQRRPDPKLWKLNAWYYLGLHYDAVGDVHAAKQCMKRALLLASGGNASDIIHVLPMLHMSQRNWFDDEDDNCEEEPKTSGVSPINENDAPMPSSHDSTRATNPHYSAYKSADPYFVQSLQTGLEEMRYYDLRDALRAKGISGTGTKVELVQRLMLSVLTEAGQV